MRPKDLFKPMTTLDQIRLASLAILFSIVVSVLLIGR